MVSDTEKIAERCRYFASGQPFSSPPGDTNFRVHAMKSSMQTTVVITLVSSIAIQTPIGCRRYPSSGSTADVSATIEHEHRAAIFRHLYTQIEQYYVEDNVLQLPDDFADVAATLYLHSSIDWRKLRHNPQRISLDPKDGHAMHTILLYDSSDVGDGSIRLILFADGHVEFSTWYDNSIGTGEM